LLLMLTLALHLFLSSREASVRLPTGADLSTSTVMKR